METSLPPGTRGIPFIEHTHAFLTDPLHLLMKAYHKYGEVFYLHVFRLPNVFMIGPKSARFVLQEHPDWFSSREGNLIICQRLFGESVLFSDGAQHSSLLAGVMPAFRPNALEKYVDTMVDIITWEAKGWLLEKEIDIFQKAKRIALEILARTLLGTSFAESYNIIQRKVHTLASGLYADNTIDLPWTWFGKGRRSRDVLYELLDPLVNYHRKTQSGENLINLLINYRDLNGQALTNREIIDQINTFLFAGYDTSSSTMAWIIWYLTQNPDVVRTIETEFGRIIGSRPITYDGIKQLKYVDCVLKEVERLKPPAYFIPRMATRDVTYEGYTIPKGWLVNIVPLVSHRLPEIYSDPDRFDPNRFMPPREEHKKIALSLIGFGTGPKTCVGILFAQIEIKIFLYVVLRMYKIRAKDDKEPRSNWIPSLHPQKGPIVTIEPR